MGFAEQLALASTLMVRQRFELAEMFSIETRNKYAIEGERGEPVAFAAEQQKSFAGFLLRQVLGHWREFEIIFFDTQRQPVLRAIHPFRIFFQRLEVKDAAGRRLGAVQQRFALLSKRFDVEASNGRVILEVRSPLWRLWTFVFVRGAVEAARIEKKWSGLLAESFTDKDNFRIQFSGRVSLEERQLLLAAAIFIDLQYFENKAGN
jgi:uncharacterized protein YxjI